MSAPVAALLRLNAWGPGEAAVTAGSSSTSATALPTGAIKIAMKASQKAHVRFGTSAVSAATTNDYPLTADVDYVIDIPPGVTHYRAIRGGSSDATVNVVAMNP